jgi:hypothetical protein
MSTLIVFFPIILGDKPTLNYITVRIMTHHIRTFRMDARHASSSLFFSVGCVEMEVKDLLFLKLHIICSQMIFTLLFLKLHIICSQMIFTRLFLKLHIICSQMFFTIRLKPVVSRTLTLAVYYETSIIQDRSGLWQFVLSYLRPGPGVDNYFYLRAG